MVVLCLGSVGPGPTYILWFVESSEESPRRRIPTRRLLGEGRLVELAFFGEVDAGDDDGGGEDGGGGKGFFEPDDRKRYREGRLEVGEDGGLRSLDKLLTFLVGPEGDDGSPDSHK